MMHISRVCLYLKQYRFLPLAIRQSALVFLPPVIHPVGNVVVLALPAALRNVALRPLFESGGDLLDSFAVVDSIVPVRIRIHAQSNVGEEIVIRTVVLNKRGENERRKWAQTSSRVSRRFRGPPCGIVGSKNPQRL